MQSKIVSSIIRHVVTFSPDPENPSHATPPVYVTTKDVSALADIPRGVQHLNFRDVVEIEVMVGGQVQVVRSGYFNEKHHFVMWDAGEVKRLEESGSHVQVAVPPYLEGKAWVLGSRSTALAQVA